MLTHRDNGQSPRYLLLYFFFPPLRLRQGKPQAVGGALFSATGDNEQQTYVIDNHEKYSGTNQISSQRYNGKSNDILSDDKSTDAQMSIEGSTRHLANISDAD